MLDWVLKHRKGLMTYGLGALAVLMSAYAFYSRSHPSMTGDFFSASALYQKWAGGDLNDRELLKKLEALLDRHPELHPKFDALIAERLLMWDEPKGAALYLTSALDRVDENSSFYSQFAKTTLAVSEGKFVHALEDAKSLREEMSQDPTLMTGGKGMHWGGMLYAFNLIRIAMLEQEAGSKEGEVAAWDELIGLREKDEEAFTLINYHFREGALSLFDYIQHRKMLLN
jgi:hypothetical protein